MTFDILVNRLLHHWVLIAVPWSNPWKHPDLVPTPKMIKIIGEYSPDHLLSTLYN
jgi:hypothetical protein